MGCWNPFALTRRGAVALTACLALAATLRGDVLLAPVFTDGVVLQQEKTVPVWGTAGTGEKIVVTFAGQTRSATTGTDGRWIVLFDPLKAESQGSDLVATGPGNAVTIHDAVVGEVWLFAGEATAELSSISPAEIAASHLPLVRQVRIARQGSAAPTASMTTSGWRAAVPSTAGDFNATAYAFARDVHQRLGVPVGIVECSFANSPLEAWMSPMALASDPAFAVVAERWMEMAGTFSSAKADYDVRISAWNAAESAARTRGAKAHATWLRQNARPAEPHGAPGDPWTPAGLFNGMINPVLPYSIRGVLWWQGESNAARPSEYRALFSALITTYRAHFGQGDVPFLWVNLPAYRLNDPSDLALAKLREAQTRTLSLPNTGQAIAVDLAPSETNRVPNPLEIGRRLALLAKHRVYGGVIDDAGPTFASAEREGAGMRVRFNDASGGLVAQDRPPDSLELAGSDRVFRPATARIVQDSLLVSSPAVRDPIAVRYAWHNDPDANLYSGNGLPVAPFRSDDW